MKKKHWYDYLYIYTPIYLALGFFNITFAWLGLIEFFIPLIIAIVGGNKSFCNHYCARGQLFDVLGRKCKLSLNRKPPKFLLSVWFRYAFLAFFMSMFILMIVNTVQVFYGTGSFKQAVTLLWVFRLPWEFAYVNTNLPLWVSQFAFGMYSVMFTSAVLGFITMVLFRPRSWCAYCPMGTMTQGICKLRKGMTEHGRKSKTIVSHTENHL